MITVFGSLNIDMVFPVEAMPRPGDTLLCPQYRLYPGGKGANQAVAAARLNSQVHLFGALGSDGFAVTCRESLTRAGVNHDHVITADLPTGCAMICVDRKGENMITVASGANLQAQSGSIPDDHLTADTVVLMQMEVPVTENWALVHRAAARGSRIILNLAPAQPLTDEILSSLYVLIMNQLEATSLATVLGFDVISPTVAARRIASRYGIICIVTLGSDGAFAASPQGTWTVKSLPITALDTTAAGDAFVGALAACLDQGMALEEALHYAAVASGLACIVSGAQSSLPTMSQVIEALPRLMNPRRAV